MKDIREGTIISITETELGKEYQGSKGKWRNCIVVEIYESEYSDEDNEYFVVETTLQEQKEYGISKNRIFIPSLSSFALLEKQKLSERIVKFSNIIGEINNSELDELIFEIDNNNNEY